MKVILLSLLVISSSLLGAEPKVVSFDKIQYRIKDGSELAYIPNQETPFTGKAVDFYKNGQKEKEGNYKDGKAYGLMTVWYENGQKKWEGNYKDGLNEGLATKWYENGQMEREGNYKDGKIISAVVWKPNGEKCPVTNVKDGNGVVVSYNEDGTEVIRFTYEDGAITNSTTNPAGIEKLRREIAELAYKISRDGAYPESKWTDEDWKEFFETPAGIEARNRRLNLLPAESKKQDEGKKE